MEHSLLPFYLLACDRFEDKYQLSLQSLGNKPGRICPTDQIYKGLLHWSLQFAHVLELWWTAKGTVLWGFVSTDSNSKTMLCDSPVTLSTCFFCIHITCLHHVDYKSHIFLCRTSAKPVFLQTVFVHLIIAKYMTLNLHWLNCTLLIHTVAYWVKIF